jgi:DNA-binding NtrC family response regulator
VGERVPTALVVEDEPRMRELLVDVIGGMGLAVTGARSGEEALRAMRDAPADVLVLDLHLPGIGGMEVFERVRKEWPGAQVIVLTAYGDLPAAQRAVHLDAVEFLTKPSPLSDIEMAVDRARRRVVGVRQGSSMEQAAPPGGALADVEHREILAALRRHGGNRTAAAAELGISRRTLHYRLSDYRRRGLAVE